MSDERGAELQPGQRFGSYEIVRPLGRGAFGAVYEAPRPPLKKRTALKVLHAEYVRHAEASKRVTTAAGVALFATAPSGRADVRRAALTFGWGPGTVGVGCGGTF